MMGGLARALGTSGVAVVAVLVGCRSGTAANDALEGGEDVPETVDEAPEDVALGEPAGDPGVPDAAETWARPRFCEVDEARVEAVLAAMTLPDKAGQVLIVGGTGTANGPSPQTRSAIEEVGVGGVFLVPGAGVQMHPLDTARLIVAMQQAALGARGIPLFVTLDQEGGHAAALNSLNGGTDTPGSLALGQTRDEGAVHDCHDVMGRELHALGFNMDFAPVLDSRSDPDNGALNTRPFSDDPALVARLAPPAVWGLENHLVLGTIKHFPSVGPTPLDTHADLPVVDMAAGEFRATVLAPFRAAIQAGADAVMTGHIIYAAMDPDFPASMSSLLIRTVLREELGFDGVVVTDSVGMAGATLGAGPDGPTVRALIAGNDIVLQAGTEVQGARDKRDEVLAAVADGRLPEADLDTAVRRILRYKMKYCAFDAPFPDETLLAAEVGTGENRLRTQAAADRSVVLLRDDAQVLPLDPDRPIAYVGPGRFYLDPGSGWWNVVDRTLGDALADAGADVVSCEVAMPPSTSDAAECLEVATTASVVVLASINAHYSPEQTTFLLAFKDVPVPVVLVTLGVPYDAWDIPVPTVLNVTGQRSVSLIAAARVLFGEIPATGRPAVNMMPP